MKKRKLVWLLAAGICLTTVGAPAQIKAAESVWAEETSELETEIPEVSNETTNMHSEEIPEPQLLTEELPTGGLLPMEVYELDETEVETEVAPYFVLPDGEYSVETDLHGAAYVTSEWDKYKNYYFYNKMSEAQQDYWDDLEVLCDDYLLNNTAGVLTKDGKYRTPLLKSDMGLTIEEMKSVARAFRYNNPQYYFINNSLWATSKAVGFGIYTAFATPEDRAAETAKVKAQADTWQAEIDALSTAEEKERLIHDLIVKKVDYNHAIEQSGFDENTQYTQSAYSVFCTDLTVCAGYSQAFAMMCNASGIDAVCVTSSSHEWNKVRLNDSWYNVDCTWDDQGGNRVGYYYFNRNDSVFDTSSSHAESAGWLLYLPVCTLDSGSTYSAPGTLPTITEQAEKPVISGETVDGTYMVTITSNDPDAEIYYTIDGDMPEVAEVKCKYYGGSFEATEESLIQALTVKNASWDSMISSNGYWIAYEGNGNSSGNMKQQSIHINKSERLKNNLYSRVGYTFVGWNTNQDGSGTCYEDGATIKNLTDETEAVVTLYAQWIPNQYGIHFNGNGNDGGQMEEMSGLVYDTEYQLTRNLFVKEGYNFIGWNTQADGSGETYANGATIRSLTDAADGEVTLYAQWELTPYKITYELNGGIAVPNPTSYNYEQTVTFAEPTRAGYQFAGWYGDAGLTQKVDQIKAGSTGDKTLYAKWLPNQYSICFNGNGNDSGQMEEMTGLAYDAEYQLTGNLFQKKYYTFVNWNTKADGSGETYADGAAIRNLTDEMNGEVTLYAQWEPRQYKIVYKLNGGKNNKKNPATYTKYTGAITLKKPTRTGYTFKGWYSNKKCTKKVTGIKKGATGTKTFYAKWQKKKYKINYQLNGGTNSSKNPTSYTVTSKTVKLKAPKKNGYVFKGWYTDKKCKKKITKIKKGSVGNLTLYAKWKKK